MTAPQLSVGLDGFGHYLHGTGLSPNTTRVYVWRLGKLADWCIAEGVDIGTVTAEDVLRHVETMGDSRTARSQLRAALLHYWVMTGREDAPDLVIVEIPKWVPAETWKARDYREHLVEEGLNPRTIHAYTREVVYASAAMHKRGTTLMPARGIDIVAYCDTRPTSRTTRLHIRSALGHFWTWKGRLDTPINAIRVPPKPMLRPRSLKLDDARMLVKTATGWATRRSRRALRPVPRVACLGDRRGPVGPLR